MTSGFFSFSALRQFRPRSARRFSCLVLKTFSRLIFSAAVFSTPYRIKVTRNCFLGWVYNIRRIITRYRGAAVMYDIINGGRPEPTSQGSQNSARPPRLPATDRILMTIAGRRAGGIIDGNLLEFSDE